jgi:Kef-type K+ transport system membrane component KefB
VLAIYLPLLTASSSVILILSMHELGLFVELSLLIILVTLVSIVMRLLRQPLILGYIIAGLIVGTAVPLLSDGTLHISPHGFDIFSSLGIVLLLFIIGLELRVAVLKQLGVVVFVIALAILLIVGGIGQSSAMLFGFSFIEGVILGLALFFSSTIVIVKMLSDKKEHTRLHGQITIGVILLDDIVATLALLFVAAGKNGGLHVSEIGFLFLKGALLVGALSFTAVKLLPKLSHQFAKSQELLFLFAISWGLGIATLFQWAGFSIEVGALFAGVSLASLPYTKQMESRLKPLRDFFIVIFFVTLGAELHLDNIISGLVPALLLSLLVITLKPILVMLVMRLFRYTKRTSFKVGINLSQISEFSIILAVVATAAGMVDEKITAIITVVALITITTSTYLMQYDTVIFSWLERRLPWLREPEDRREKNINDTYELVLFGYRRGGHEFVKTFRKMEKKFTVIDYDPAMIETLERLDVPHMYGDATDIEFLRDVGLKHAKLVVSTITHFSTNEDLVQYVHKVNPEAVIVCYADDSNDAEELYRMGVSYVMLPHYIGSERINHFIRKNGTAKKAFAEYRKQHLSGLPRVES